MLPDDPLAGLLLLCACWPGLLPMLAAYLVGRYLSINVGGLVSRRRSEL